MEITTGAMIELHIVNLAKKFGNNLIFRDLSFVAKTGDRLVISGPNGSGKSTLLKIIAGLLRPSRGKSLLLHNNVHLSGPARIAQLGMLSQEIELYQDLTAFEHIRLLLHPARHTRAREMCDSFNLSDALQQKIRYYSSGMRQRFKFVLAVINKPPLLLLDEPLSFLDRDGESLLYSYLERIQQESLVIIASNNPREREQCSRGITLA